MMRKSLLKKSLLVFLLLLTACSSKTKPEYVKPEVNSVYYEIYVGSFYDSDGDGKGDLKGVMEKLDYIQKDLGASGIWLMPINPSPTYHKYDVIDYKDIDPDYGTMEDFDALVKEMNDRDMDLILDLVLNHTSSEHPWFLKAKEEMKNDACTLYCEYYNFSDQSLAHYEKIQDGLYYEAEFWSGMPDLNLDSEYVRDHIKDITKFWLDKGIKGFRLDATTHFYADDTQKNIEFLDWFGKLAKSFNPDVYIVGEAWKDINIIQPMYASGISFFNFSLAQNNGRLVKDINKGNGTHLAMFMESYQNTIEEYQPDAIDSIFFSNHDNGRSASYFAGQLEKQKLASSVYLLLPGNVFVYYGEEIGMIGSGKDENKRLPMLWGDEKGKTTKPSGADYAIEMEMNVKDEMNNKDSLFNHYQKVIGIRNQYPEISRSNGKAIDLGDPALFAMMFDEVMVVHNFSDEAKEFEGNYEIINNELGGKATKEKILLEGFASVIIKAK